MQQRERQGAWVLFVGILIFAAIVFSYGMCRRQEVRDVATQQIQNINSNTARNLQKEDSVKNKKKDYKVKKKGNRSRKSKSVKKNYDKVRDILADTINVNENGVRKKSR